MRNPFRGTRLAALAAVAALLLAACAKNAPQDTLDPAGPVARQIDGLFKPVFWIAAGVFFLVEGLLVFALLRFRHRKGRDGVPEQTHGNTRLEIAWTLAPALLLAGIAIPTVGAIFDLAQRPADAVQVTITAKQWWWAVEYPDLGVITANEIHIPVGKRVDFTLKSDNVIHSFWVPRLAGKQDVVPGHVNHLVMEAETPGEYRGQCVEFCGASHANMRLRLFADTPGDFDRWVNEQKADAAVPAEGSLAARGMAIFNDPNLCIRCHAVGGGPGSQVVAPSLTHFASRTTFAGSIFENDEANLRRWLADPPAVKPGSLMPDYGLSHEQIDALVAYLESLK
ncbi:MAG TPA: cytochrome c oxidase subunit II [Actinomycetota bacterium]|nr:cytochrome c oxidase subunit II [Actinomycetota bacterium]